MVIKELLKETKIDRHNLPHHVALSVEGCREFSAKNNIPYEEITRQKFFNVKNIIRTCVKLGIPLFTFYIFPSSLKDESEIISVVDGLVDFFEDLKKWDFVKENQIKVSVLGKWYDLPGRLVEPIKETIQDTKDYDKFFLNLCINYDGQEEIVDAARLIARQVKSGRLDPESISKSDIKENIYASYFLPPELIIKTGTSRKIDGFLLWDSVNSKIYFSNKPWPDFGKLEFLKALEFFQK
ncbi:di-trans,poly-cis-decaprenylcistransferase [Candidatus Woesearchaeota archaeon]|nr:di-trans,poly-cis-decaprenylcistransferase [Candidatus Woesearchaeota archaeon]